MTRNGQLISYALYVGIAISAVILSVNTAAPFLQTMQESSDIRRMTAEMTQLEEAIQQVGQGGVGTQRQYTLRIVNGELAREDQSLVFGMETESGAISSGTIRNLGRIRISANAQASVRNASHDGQSCYLMENQYIETCIMKFGDNSDFRQGALNDTILYIRNKVGNTTIEPSLDYAINDDVAYSTGKMRTMPVNVGENLAAAELAVLVKPANRPVYRLNIRLPSNSDFLSVQTR